MTETTTQQALIGDVEALKRELEQVPRTDAIEKALYHAERLRVALSTSHTEGTRFAAFTVNRLIRGLEGDLPAAIPARMQQIRAALEARGLDFNK